MDVKQYNYLEEVHNDLLLPYKLLRVQQIFPVVHPPSSPYASSPTHYITTSFFEKTSEEKTQETELFITGTWKFPEEREETLTVAQAFYNQDFALDLLYSFSPSADNFELETIIKFKKFDKITDIYIEEGEQFINIKIFINLEQYDYNLMSDIFNDAEFPLKDKFEKDKFLNFQYIYKTIDQYEFIEILGKRIFHRS